MAENLDKNGIFPQSNIFVEEIDVKEIEHVEVFIFLSFCKYLAYRFSHWIAFTPYFIYKAFPKLMTNKLITNQFNQSSSFTIPDRWKRKLRNCLQRKMERNFRSCQIH